MATTSRRVCCVLVVGWAVFGAAGCVWEFLVSTMPYTVPSDPPFPPAWIPVWVSSVIEIGGLFLVQPWAVLPVALLVIGLIHLRRAAPAGWRWPAAWAAAVAVGLGLEELIGRGFAIPQVSPAYGGPPVVFWILLPESVGYLVVGTAMIGTLMGAARSSIRESPAREEGNARCRPG